MAYSLDLRKRVIEAYYEKKIGAQRTIAKIFSISLSTVQRWLKQYQEKGAVQPAGHGGGNRAKLDEKELEIVYQLQMAKPDSTLTELLREFEKEIGKKVSESTISRALQKLRLTRKKKLFVQVNKKQSGL